MSSGILMSHTSKEGHYVTVCTDIYIILEILYEIEDLHTKMYLFGLYFSIVHISTNIVLKI